MVLIPPTLGSVWMLFTEARKVASNGVIPFFMLVIVHCPAAAAAEEGAATTGTRAAQSNKASSSEGRRIQVLPGWLAQPRTRLPRAQASWRRRSLRKSTDHALTTPSVLARDPIWELVPHG